ncbi:MAG: hypothetical protein O2923_01785 [Verrucomicrobia bacterium]|nr:hypothetical protein [Verrucomicrobiota bacterium]MDA1085652.1 hypothetical protein [Verrucomicrobiota bacterium]
MPEYQVNLIGETVLAPRRRRVAHTALVLYLLLCGAVLVVVAYRETRVLIAAIGSRGELSRLDSQFRLGYPGHDTIEEYDQVLDQKLHMTVDSLAAIGDVLDRQTSVSGLMLWLTEPLPAEMFLADFSLEADEHEVRFAIAVPARRQGSDAIEANDLIALWEENPQLMNRIDDLKLLISRRQILDRRRMRLWSFSGQLKKGRA